MRRQRRSATQSIIRAAHDAAEDEQGAVAVVTGLPDFVWREDRVGSRCGGAPDLHVQYLASATTQQVEAFAAVDIIEILTS